MTFKNLSLVSRNKYLKQLIFTTNIAKVKSELVLIEKINKQSKIYAIIHIKK